MLFDGNTKKLQFSIVVLFINKKMASRERFELPTDGLEGRCSIQLSYRDMFRIPLNTTPSIIQNFLLFVNPFLQLFK